MNDPTLSERLERLNRHINDPAFAEDPPPVLEYVLRLSGHSLPTCVCQWTARNSTGPCPLHSR